MRKSAFSSQLLLHYLRKGAYDQFLESLNLLASDDPCWFRIQMLGFNVLIKQKCVSEALNYCRLQSNGLIDVEQRQCMQAHFLYLNWLYQGRRQSDLAKLEAISQHQLKGTYNAHWESIQLRISAMKLLFGLMDVKEKPSLLYQYRGFVDECINKGWLEEAFFSLSELIELSCQAFTGF